MANLVNPDRYGILIAEISAGLWIDGNPSIKVKPVRKLRSSDDVPVTE
jgi:hypothetical protein